MTSSILTLILTWSISENSVAAAEAPSYITDHEDHLNQHKNSHKLSDKKGHPILSLLESQWNM